MGLKQLAQNIGFRIYGALGGSVSSYSTFFSFLGGSKRNWSLEAGRVYDNSAVSGGLLWIWRNMQYPRLMVQQRVVDEGAPIWKEVVGHKWPEIVENGWYYDDSVLFHSTIVCWNIDGNAYWYKLRNAIGQVISYYSIPPWQIEVMTDRQETGQDLVTYYRYTPVGGSPIDIDPIDILHLRHGQDPFNPAIGLSPLKSSLREVVGDNAAATICVALMESGGVSGIIFSPKQGYAAEMTPAEKRKFETEFQRRSTGDLAGLPNVLKFPLDVVQIGKSPAEISLDKQRALFVSRILTSIGIDPMVIGLDDGSRKTYSNYGEAVRSAYDNTLIPNMMIWSKQISRDIRKDPTYRVPFSSTHRVWWDFTEVPALQEDQTEIFQRANQAYDSGWLKRSEVRSLARYKSGPEDDVYKSDITAAATARDMSILAGAKSRLARYRAEQGEEDEP